MQETIAMYQGLLHLHNVLRWVILILVVVALYRHLAGMGNPNKPYSNKDKKIDLFLMISVHVQLLIGLYQWFFGQWGLKLISNAGMGAVMKDPVFRFWSVEHIAGMLIATILITIGRGVSKKPIPDVQKHKKIFWYFIIALFFILASIPWPGRDAARPLFPGA